jgi:hypothetical protein
MKVNALQSQSDYSKLGFGQSTITTNEVMRRTGVSNAIIAGGLPIDEETLASLPLARRLLCKWSLHRHVDGGLRVDCEQCLAKLMDAKRLAARDTRIDGYHIDDFSTGSIAAGAAPEHLQRLLFANAVHGPRLPISSTIYHMSLEIPQLPPLLPYFDQFLLPLWHADQIESVPAHVARLGELSGHKPIMLCLYVYDFGQGRHIPRALMQRHLAVAEDLIRRGKVTGLCVCGTCMMDLDWESNHVLFDWLEKAGDIEIE